MLDAVIISDLHLGSSNCQARQLCAFLEDIVEHRRQTAKLILNGDVFDSFDFRRLSKSHWKVLSLLRKLSDRLEIIWISGNHDGSAEIVSHLLGVTVKEEYTLKSGERHILILHGHTFDAFIDDHPWLTWLGDCIYGLLQWLDRTHSIARLAKSGSKTFLRCVQKVEDGARLHAHKKQAAAVCCGHTHFATANAGPGVGYYNSGCWTEAPCTYLTVEAGNIELHAYETELVENEAEVVENVQPALAP